jgi:small-conductance mechanosensitive channel
MMVGKLATVAVGVLSGLIILQIFGVNIAPLLAFGSIGAASIGFAGKDVMANFCSGIMLHITRPFIIGDQIYLPEKNLEGHYRRDRLVSDIHPR